MNKRFSFLVFLLCLGMLSGCTGSSVREAAESANPLNPAAVSEPADTLPEEESAEVTNLTDEEITALIDTYLVYERYTVYASDSMQMEPNYIEIDGRFYHKVTDEAYDTWAEWTAFVERIFCGDYLTERMKNEVNFINVDGHTYCQAGGMGWYVSGEYTYKITESSAERVVIEMTREELNPGGENLSHINTFALHRTDSGWRIGEWLPSHSAEMP